MPLAWSAVQSSPDYMKLDPASQSAAKQQYFDTVVAPKVPKESLADAKSQFFTSTATGTPAQEWAKSRTPGSAEMTLLQGAAGGIGDEIMGGMGAAETGLSNLGTYLTGGTPKFGMGDAYDAVRDQARVNEKSFPTDYPGGNQNVGYLVGGLMTGGGAGKKAVDTGVTAAGRLLRGSGVGATAGGVAGFGSGEDGFVNRAKSAGTGMLTGAGLGLGLATGAEAIPIAARVVGWGSDIVKDVFRGMHGMSAEEAAKTMSPERLAQAKDAAIEVTNRELAKRGKTPADLTEDPAFKAGKPVTGAEAGGMDTVLASLARRSGTTADAAESQFRLRGDERPGRLQENLANAASLDVAHTEGKMAELSDSLREKNAPLYNRAFDPDINPPPNMADPALIKIMKQPNFQQGLEVAKEAAANTGEAIDPKNLSWENFDLIKRVMGDNISRKHTNYIGEFITGPISDRDVEGLGNLRDHLFAANPDYKAAVAQGGEPIRLEEAYNNAARLMDNGKTSAYNFHAAINDMSPAEIEATKSGFVNDVYTKLQAGKLNPKDLTQPAFREKAGRLLGEPQARQLIDEAGQELRLRGGEQRIPAKMGSGTMGLQTAKDEHDDALAQGLYQFGSNMRRRGPVSAMWQAGIDAAWQAFQAAKTPEKEAIRNEVGKLLLMKPDELRATLERGTGTSTKWQSPLGEYMSPSSAMRSEGKPLDPKSREIGQMILHLMQATPDAASSGLQKSIAPAANAAAQQ